MKFISHRGAAGLAIENSLESITLAERYSPFLIEIDIHVTSDGICVLHHGDLQRTYTGKPLDKTYKELKAEFPSIARLDELVRLPIQTPMLLDIKVKELPKEFYKTLEAARPEFKHSFTSPHIRPLLDVRDAFPKSRTYISQPYHEGPFRPIELARKYHFDGCNVNKWWVGPITYHMSKRYNIELFTYTIDRSITMRLVRLFFPRITIVSNRPDICIQI